MTPSSFDNPPAHDQPTPADGRDNETQPPYRTADAAGAATPVPHSQIQGNSSLGMHRHLDTSSPSYAPFTFLRQLPQGLPPALPPRGHGYGFNGLPPPYAQVQHNPHLRPVQPSQLQPAWMHHQPTRAHSPALYGALERQGFHVSPQVSYVQPEVYGNPRTNVPRPVLPPPHYRPQLSSIANMFQSRGHLNAKSVVAHATPPVQEWPTWNLTQDAVAQSKQEGKAKAAEEGVQGLADRHSAAYSLQPSGDTQPTSSSIPATTEKRKLSMGAEEPRPTLPPRLRRSTRTVNTGPASAQRQSGSNVLELRSDHSMNQDEQTKLHTLSASNEHGTKRIPLQHYPHAAEPLPSHATSSRIQNTDMLAPADPTPREAFYQPITDIYEQYKWPVKLYELRSDTKFDFAHSYMDDWFEKNIFSSRTHKWHCHTTKGFIKGGNRFSILVLHNAADPFTWNSPSKTTTSIAFYTRCYHTHDEFRWTTITPWIPDFFRVCTDFFLRTTWDADLEKATDRRFHRAYWLAANMRPLGRLLNCAPMNESPFDEPEPGEIEQGPNFTEDDLQNQWVDGPPTVEDCDRVWQRILNETEWRDMQTLGSDHIAIGGTERQWESDH